MCTRLRVCVYGGYTLQCVCFPVSLSMYVCMYECMYGGHTLHIHTCMHTTLISPFVWQLHADDFVHVNSQMKGLRKFVCVYKCIFTSVFICFQMLFTSVYLYVILQVCIYMCIFIYLQVYIYMFSNVVVFAYYICACIYILKHVFM